MPTLIDNLSLCLRASLAFVLTPTQPQVDPLRSHQQGPSTLEDEGTKENAITGPPQHHEVHVKTKMLFQNHPLTDLDKMSRPGRVL
jgi:hypothetical protein